MKKLGVLAALALVAGLMAMGGGVAQAAVCDATVTASASVQAAIDANPGGNVCLDDSGGAFGQSVVFGPEDSGVTLRAEPGDSPILDGAGGVLVDGIRLADGVHHVTIEGLEIANYTGGPQASAITSWDVSTSHINVRDNYLHDNTWNGVLVGSEGDVVHNNWKVAGNTADDNGFVGIELTNCNNCQITGNSATGNGFAGIVVQARNTTVGGPAVDIKGVNVIHNALASSPYGIYALSLSGHPTAFTNDPPKRGSASLSSVVINNNTVTGTTSYGVRFWAFNDEAAAGNANINHNSIDCTAGASYGVRVQEAGLTGTGTVTNVNVMNNSIAGACSTANVSVAPGTGRAKNN